jgi:predicted ATPase
VGLEAAGNGLFVGRDTEVARLVDLLGVGQQGGGSSHHGSVVLSGDAGIGKTRLLSEVVATARSSGWLVLVGHCLGETGQSLPYLPFSELLGRL